MVLKDISTYDNANKLAMPTIEYVTLDTGVELITAQGTRAKAQSYIRQMSRVAKAILHSERSPNVAIQFDELIKEDEEYRLEFINFVCSLIYDFYVLGIDDFFKTSEGNVYRDALSVKSKVLLDSGKLGIKRFDNRSYNRVI